MVDTEICVDRIVAMRVHDMNVVLAEARKTVMEKHNSGENDLYIPFHPSVLNLSLSANNPLHRRIVPSLLKQLSHYRPNNPKLPFA